MCCTAACTGTRDFCSSDGQTCVQCDNASQCGNGCNLVQGLCNPLRQGGDQCTVNGQCGSSRCVQDVSNPTLSRCCGNCAAGQRCDSFGRCVDPLSDLGGRCSSASDCRAGLSCAPNGICCDAPCNGVCESCGANGRCGAPADDNRCDDVLCDALANECRSTSRLTANLCRGRGQCKTVQDCQFNDRNDGVACGPATASRVCQDGACVDPVVQCGLSSCSIGGSVSCCYRSPEVGSEVGFSCRTDCFASGIFQPIQPIGCDSPDDCRPGNLCCLDITVNARFAQLSCMPAAECNVNEPASGQLRFAQICRSLSFNAPGSCPAGRSCQAVEDDAILPGFGFCASR